MAQPFDADSARTTGDSIPIAEQVDSSVGGQMGLFSVSQNGILVYSTGRTFAEAQLTWFDRSGKALEKVGPAGDLAWPVISPDGKTVAVGRLDVQTGIQDVWLHDLARGSSYRLTSYPNGSSQFPIWSPDGLYVGYYRTASVPNGLYRRAASGAGVEEVLYESNPPMRPDDWSRDGRYLIGETGRNARGGNLWVMPVSSDAKPYQFLRSEFREIQARISPDSHWVAYVSDRTGHKEVYVTSFPVSGAQTRISTAGGVAPVWSRDGRELYYVAPERDLMAVTVKAAASLEAGTPRLLFQVNLFRFDSNTSRFDVSKDGRFLIPVALDIEAKQSMIAVVNWTAALKR
jgi:hypothetical protein